MGVRGELLRVVFAKVPDLVLSNPLTSYGHSLLHLAASGGDVEVVRWVVQGVQGLGAGEGIGDAFAILKINDADTCNDGSTPLLDAVRRYIY
ncbi:hypothetical protein B484DRAFT_398395 [Ochromonadaceae sp. CCMP2298]|nr:hypothetical protein B484DRAFT_398395 [Ochromonadaceae sp. CCMP2298]